MPIRKHSLKNIHFVGIGGIGMSGIAEILINLGFNVQGSDLSNNQLVIRLRKLGAKIFNNHSLENISKAQVVVVSTAIKNDNPEVIEARRLKIPVVRRCEMLAEIMHLKMGIAISGSHGKTSTTSLVASILDEAGLDPTVINGGIINNYGSNARLGTGDFVVAEADESDGSFTKLPATIAVVTNIDPEHMDYFKTFDSLKNEFVKFIENIPFYGLAVVCVDSEAASEVCKRITDRRIITYGLSDNAQIRAKNISMEENGMIFDLYFDDFTEKYDEVYENIVKIPTIIKNIHLSMFGEHNVYNALAAIAVAMEIGIKKEHILKALSEFKGVKRRFSILSKHNGVTLVDDYAHHPEEMKRVVSTAKSMAKGNLYSIIQPHRYTRLQSLFDDFASCALGSSEVFVTPVYEANELPIDGINSKTLVLKMKELGINACFVESVEDLYENLIKKINTGDYVVSMGAGSITSWCSSLKEKFESTVKFKKSI